MEAGRDAKLGISPRNVIRGVNSHLYNEVGVHWLRISFNHKDLQEVKTWVERFWGSCDLDGFGLWSYDSRYFWPSGVSLNYDRDLERSQAVHRGRITLDCPGRACDMLTAPDLLLLIESSFALGGQCSRTDIFFDDYSRIVTPDQLHEVIECNDYSGFKKSHIKQTFSGHSLVHDEVMFGRRGQNGSGKYLRVYDKCLESEGEKDCIRWEVEFSDKKAQSVFEILAGCGGEIEAFVGICGALVGGCITFVHRTGDRNIKRLEVYEFWEIITELLGKLKIRIEKKETSLTGVIEWTEKQVAPSLACIAKAFVDLHEFMRWIRDVVDDGESRLNAKQRDIVRESGGCMKYNRKENHIEGIDCE